MVKFVYWIFVIINCLILLSGLYPVNMNTWFTPLNQYVFVYLLIAVLYLLCIFFVAKQMDKIKGKYKNTMIYLLVCLLFGLVSYVFIRYTKPILTADQENVFNFTFEALKGDYSHIFKGYYMGSFPYQLGLVGYQKIVLLIASLLKSNIIYNYDECISVIRFSNYLCMCISIYCGYKLVQRMSKTAQSVQVYWLFVLSFIPGMIYISFVYNDLSSMCFCLLALNSFQKYLENKKIFGFVLSIVFISIAVMIRMTSIIYVIAFFLLLAYKGLFEKERICLLLSLIMVCIPLVSQQLPVKYFEMDSKYNQIVNDSTVSLSEGSPMISNIAMGLDIEDIYYGWFNGLNWNVYFDQCEYDTACAISVSKEHLSDSLQYMKENPRETVSFFITKVASQWSDGSFSAIKETENHDFEIEPKSVTLIYSGISNVILCCIMKAVMIVVYGCTFVYTVRNKPKKMEELLLQIIVIGGFLFCFIWEAKGRYNLSYYFLLMILASIGINDKIVNK